MVIDPLLEPVVTLVPEMDPPPPVCAGIGVGHTASSGEVLWHVYRFSGSGVHKDGTYLKCLPGSHGSNAVKDQGEWISDGYDSKVLADTCGCRVGDV